ncbi:MAG: hypothetical protein M1376_04980, partial [Planctomycetes bacterium]|nr:hypothetical protein [Planctomycetota bacterium]
MRRNELGCVVFATLCGCVAVGGLNTKGYDRILEQREPHGRYYAADVADLNRRFDEVVEAGGVFYALWHPDRFKNSVIYDPWPVG